MIPCRTGAVCCHSGHVQCCFSPTLNGEWNPRKWSPLSYWCCNPRTKRLGLTHLYITGPRRTSRNPGDSHGVKYGDT